MGSCCSGILLERDSEEYNQNNLEKKKKGTRDFFLGALFLVILKREADMRHKKALFYLKRALSVYDLLLRNNFFLACFSPLSHLI
jgi:hypothetical protein